MCGTVCTVGFGLLPHAATPAIEEDDNNTEPPVMPTNLVLGTVKHGGYGGAGVGCGGDYRGCEKMIKAGGFVCRSPSRRSQWRKFHDRAIEI